MKYPVLMPLAVLLAACVTAGPPAPPPSAATPSAGDPIAIAYRGDDLMVVIKTGADRCEALADTQGKAAVRFVLPLCPDRVEHLEGTGWIFSNESRAAAFDLEGRASITANSVIAIGPSGQLLIEKSRASSTWRGATSTTELPFRPGRARFLKAKPALIAIRESVAGPSLVKVSEDGSVLVLVDGVDAIESFDLAPREGEVVFSASRNGNFDVGVVSVDGGTVQWVPSEKWPEKNVRWAPRGNKFTYSVEASGGAYLRTVHVPTSFQLMFDLGVSDVADLAWHPAAETFALLRSGPAFSPRIENVRYSGKEMKTIRSSRISVDREPQILEGGALLLAPAQVSYSAKMPLVVFELAEPHRWFEPVAAAVSSGAAVLLAPDAAAALRSAADYMAPSGWIDSERVYVVARGSGELTTLRGRGTTLILPGSASGNREPEDVVLSNDPAVFEVELSEYLRRELKGSSATHDAR